MSKNWGGLQPDTGDRTAVKKANRDPDKVYCDVQVDGEPCNAEFDVMPQLEKHISEEHDDNPDNGNADTYELTCMNCFRPVYFRPEKPGTLDNVTYDEDREYPVHIECVCGHVTKTM